MNIKYNLKKLIGSNDKAEPSIIYIEDEYINWLCFANAGMLDKGNIYCFDYAARNIHSNSVCVEIGSFCGLSANVIHYFLKKYNKDNRLICVDKWEFEGGLFRKSRKFKY